MTALFIKSRIVNQEFPYVIKYRLVSVEWIGRLMKTTFDLMRGSVLKVSQKLPDKRNNFSTRSLLYVITFVIPIQLSLFCFCNEMFSEK